ncbi:MAG: hypothetical protein O2819_04435 [Planctomycetota bacterium]|nr:hypothetical protein [Planctomycetota bacterium]MDA1106503.1 hypothetical protein [Planctomycetota bacterium]
MSKTESPIDPAECHLIYSPASGVHGALTARVPSSLVRRFRKKMRRTGADAELSDVKLALLRFLCGAASEQFKIRIVTPPMVRKGVKEPRLSLDHDFVLDVEVDTAAALKFPDCSGVELLQPESPVTEAMIDEEMNNQCLQAGKRASATAVSAPCECVARVQMRLAPEESPFYAAERDQLLIAATDSTLLVAGVAFPGVTAALIGVAAGSTTSIEASFPLDHPSALLRGRPVSISITLDSVQSIQPATVDEVLKQYGSTTEARLRTQVKFALEQRRVQSIRSTLREQMERALPTLCPIDRPECRIRLLAARAEGEFRGLARARGWSDERTLQELEAHKARALAVAERQARLRVILQSIPLASSQVDINETTLTDRIASLAAERGVRPEEYRNALVKSGKFEEFVADVAAEALLDALVRSATIKKVSEAEWRAAMEAQRA